MKRQYFVAVLPPFFDYPGNHKTNYDSGGPGVFIIKCLFCMTPYYSGYCMDKHFCQGLRDTIQNFQANVGIEVDGNFGQETRIAIHGKYGIELDRIPREMIEGSDSAIHPDGNQIIWPEE